MHQAKRMLAQLVRRAAAGETVLIGLNRRAIVKLIGLNAPAVSNRRLGFLKGKLVIPDSLDAPLPNDVLADFEGGL